MPFSTTQRRQNASEHFSSRAEHVSSMTRTFPKTHTRKPPRHKAKQMRMKYFQCARTLKALTKTFQTENPDSRFGDNITQSLRAHGRFNLSYDENRCVLREGVRTDDICSKLAVTKPTAKGREADLKSSGYVSHLHMRMYSDVLLRAYQWPMAARLITIQHLVMFITARFVKGFRSAIRIIRMESHCQRTCKSSWDRARHHRIFQGKTLFAKVVRF